MSAVTTTLAEGLVEQCHIGTLDAQVLARLAEHDAQIFDQLEELLHPEWSGYIHQEGETPQEYMIHHFLNPTDSSRSPLFSAVTTHDVEAVQTLLSLGANPNWQNGHGETALCLAISQLCIDDASSRDGKLSKDMQIIELLTDHGTVSKECWQIRHLSEKLGKMRNQEMAEHVHQLCHST